MPDAETDGIDWSLTSWEGARREQLRRWAELPLERVVLALEEMEALADWLSPGAARAARARRQGDDPT
jgi:hypothetical protein